MMDLLILFIVAVACIGFGFILDNLIKSVRSLGKPKESNAAPVETPGAEPAPAQELASEIGQSPPAPESVVPEAVHLWRDPQGPGLILEVGGKQVRSLAELDQEQIRRVSEILGDLNGWFRQEDKARTAIIPAKENLAPAFLPEVPTTEDLLLAEILPPEEDFPGKAQRPSLNPISVVTNALRSDIRRPSISEKSLATQVDVVLQAKMKGTALEKRGIHLLDAPDQGLWVQVGLVKYNGVDDVPEAEIRDMIREAVSEWSRKTAK